MLTIIGKIIQLLPTQEGESAKGPWIRGGFVLEYGEEYPRKAAFTVFGKEKMDSIQTMVVGQLVKVIFNPQSREFEGRWYTDLSVVKVEPAVATEPVPATAAPQPAADDDNLF